MDQLFSELKEIVLKDLSKEKSSDSPRKTTKEKAKKDLKTGVEVEFDRPLVLKADLCYIVSAVIIENGKVLMMKEAKKSCRGLWYLPAGRLEKNESLIEGVKREVLEETGLHFEPTSLISVDNSRVLSWQRFNFTGNVTGGKLKTIKDEDKESMEAGWFEPQEVFSRSLPLRAPDIIPHIKSTLKWKEMKERDPIYTSLPVPLPHERIKIQVVLVSCDGNNGIKICLDKEYSMGFLHCTPSTLFCSVYDTVYTILKRALGIDKVDYQLHGIISIEHVGKPHGAADGACLTLLAEFIPTSQPKPSNPGRYFWLEADERLKSRIRQLLEKGCVKIV
ncbi:8-oxo-dGDP phosphatase NUDT18-like [Actinia tenebrosa]|uniref:8-oxo-dGDP phosphatase NUDT18-like n=1 Tax=Actinia tenebrosa TaxID=6105 RepID=A0A6P8IEP0_ACTTE|nr:8-oxo-dGDP phosphatase NUDT18-like [Actinia tenebrosa]